LLSGDRRPIESLSDLDHDCFPSFDALGAVSFQLKVTPLSSKAVSQLLAMATRWGCSG
jgi:hypothetical protein